MNAKTIKIGFVGDLCLAMANTYPAEFLDQNLALCTKLNDGVDLSVANHE
ncbi:MAG: hypothetical protein JKY84_07655, partial [Emcibacteraceae bacterium]|nr:hypothetical protein [Emcibacteraceae bacterium]